jgi:hypothetical protein
MASGRPLPLPGSAELADQAGYGPGIPASERVQAAVVLLADGSLRAFAGPSTLPPPTGATCLLPPDSLTKTGHSDWAANSANLSAAQQPGIAGSTSQLNIWAI